MDRAHRRTDKVIDETLEKIDKVYSDKEEELVALCSKYFNQFEEADEKKRKEYEDGLITKSQYAAWRTSTMMTGKKWKRFLHRMCKEIHSLNALAIKVSNDRMADVFVENYNFVGKDIEEQVHGLR